MRSAPTIDEIDAAPAEELADHRVGHERHVDAVPRELPGREPRALQNGARLARDDSNALASRACRAHDAERRSAAAGRQRARVAVRENRRAVRHARRADPAHRPARRDVLAVDVARLGREARHALVGREGRNARGHPSHPVERPGEVHGRRSRAEQSCARRAHRRGEGERVPPLRGRSEDDGVRGRDSDRRSAAHDEALDRLGDLLDPREALVSLGDRQRALIEQDDLAIARHELDRRVRRAAQRLGVRERHGPLMRQPRLANRRLSPASWRRCRPRGRRAPSPPRPARRSSRAPARV